MAEQTSIATFQSPCKFYGKSQQSEDPDTSRELDEISELFYCGARYYAPRNRTWLSVDPMAEVSHRWSPYNYCMNNPLRFIDPDGMFLTDYGLKRNGEIQRIGPKDDKPDRLYAINNDKSIVKDVKPITITDKKLLPELEKDKGEKTREDDFGTVTQSGTFRSAKSSNKTDMANVYKFCADNSAVEWTVDSDSKNGIYAIGTYGLDDVAPSVNELGMDPENVTQNNHSHPTPKKTMEDEVGSLDGDKDNSLSRNYPTDVYIPGSGNIHRVSKGNSQLLKRKSIAL